jgi:hypothetical protein
MVFAAASKLPRISNVSVIIWYNRLAYCGPEVLEYFLTAVTGAKLTQESFINECESCNLKKAHKIIFRKSP